MEQKYQDIDDKAVMAATEFLGREARLVAIIQEVDDEFVWERLEFSSLHVYCVERLNLSDAYAYAFTAVARKSKAVPFLKEAVAQGTLTVSQAKRITRVIKPENAATWIHTAATVKQKELEKLVNLESPSPSPSGRMKRIGGEMSELRLVIPEKIREKLIRLMDVRGATMLDALDFALEQTLERHDPLRKAARNIGKPTTLKSSSSRKAPAAVEHARHLRDQGQCTHVRPDGGRCENRRFTQGHHVKHVAHGGSNTLGNLITLCSSHHRALHKGLVTLRDSQR
jgi:hypothetical protein